MQKRKMGASPSGGQVSRYGQSDRRRGARAEDPDSVVKGLGAWRRSCFLLKLDRCPYVSLWGTQSSDGILNMR
jgi:hypothetical protein